MIRIPNYTVIGNIIQEPNKTLKDIRFFLNKKVIRYLKGSLSDGRGGTTKNELLCDFRATGYRTTGLLTIIDTGQRTIPNATAANAVSGCPACSTVGGCPTNVVQTTAFTYNSGNNVATRAVSQVCGSGTNTTPGDVEKDTITYNSDNNITSYSVQQNLDQTVGPGAQTVATLSANPVMVITNTYTPASGNPTQVVQAIQYNQINLMGGGTAAAPYFYVSKSVVSTTAGFTNTYTVPVSSEQLVAKNPPAGAETCNGYSVKASPGATTDVIGLINVCTGNGPVISSFASPYIPGTATTVSNATDNLYGTTSTYMIGLDSMSRLNWFQVTLVGNWAGAVPSKSTGQIIYDDQGRVNTIESINVVAGANYSNNGLMNFINLNNGKSASVSLQPCGHRFHNSGSFSCVYREDSKA